MDIFITYGIGSADTNTAAFDSALLNAGIGNYNLIKLSSVIPKGSNIVVKKIDFNEIEYGYKLYVVISHHIENISGKSRYIGLGWAYSKKRGGVFVEYNAEKKNELNEYLDKSIFALKKSRNLNGESSRKIIKINCISKPICGLVAAVYKSESWER